MLGSPPFGPPPLWAPTGRRHLLCGRVACCFSPFIVDTSCADVLPVVLSRGLGRRQRRRSRHAQLRDLYLFFFFGMIILNIRRCVVWSFFFISSVVVHVPDALKSDGVTVASQSFESVSQWVLWWRHLPHVARECCTRTMDEVFKLFSLLAVRSRHSFLITINQTVLNNPGIPAAVCSWPTWPSMTLSKDVGANISTFVRPQWSLKPLKQIGTPRYHFSSVSTQQSRTPHLMRCSNSTFTAFFFFFFFFFEEWWMDHGIWFSVLAVGSRCSFLELPRFNLVWRGLSSVQVVTHGGRVLRCAANEKNVVCKSEVGEVLVEVVLGKSGFTMQTVTQNLQISSE